MPRNKDAAAASTGPKVIYMQSTGINTASAAAAVTTHLENPPSRKIVNELLAFVMFYRNKMSADSLHRHLTQHFTPSDITDAKKTLISEYGQLTGNPLSTTRRNSSSRSTHEAEIDDILGLVYSLTSSKTPAAVQFVAVDLDKVSRNNYIDDCNSAVRLCSENVSKLDCNVNQLSNELLELKKFLTSQHHDVNSVHDTFQSLKKLQEQIEYFSRSADSHFTSLESGNAGLRGCMRLTMKFINHQEASDRSLNVIIHGVCENRDISIWKQTVDEILSFIVGRSVEIVSVFRLGKFQEGKVRPIFVRLANAWDRRLIVNGRSKLKGYHQRVFVCPDETLATRRMNTFKRLIVRAMQDGKDTEIDERGHVLSVDGVPTYSLITGYISNIPDQ